MRVVVRGRVCDARLFGHAGVDATGHDCGGGDGCAAVDPRPTMGTGRSRERAIEVDVTVSVFVPGDEMVQWDASKRRGYV